MRALGVIVVSLPLLGGCDTLRALDALPSGNALLLVTLLQSRTTSSTANARTFGTTGGNGNDFFSGGDGNDRFDGRDGDDTFFGFLGNDVLDGGKGNDWVVGGPGNDILNGGKGRDIIDGGGDNDTLSGGSGIDELTGGPGNDTFIFSSAAEGGDTIVDFKQGGDLDQIDLSGLCAGALRFAGNTNETATNSINWYESESNTFIQADVDGDGDKDFEITLVGRDLGLTATDFVLCGVDSFRALPIDLHDANAFLTDKRPPRSKIAKRHKV